MTTANRTRTTTSPHEIGKFDRVRVVEVETPTTTASTAAPASEFRWVTVRTSTSLGRLSVTVSPADEARKRDNRRFNKRSQVR